MNTAVRSTPIWKTIVIALLVASILAGGCNAPALPAPTILSTPDVPPIKGEGSRYIRQESGNRGVIIFVHGFTGNSTSTWTNVETGAYWPELLTKDPTFDGYDIYTVEYPTAHLNTEYKISELPEVLRRDFETDEILKHDDLVFLVHSMGGNVTRAYINRYDDALKDRVSMIYFFATPTDGSSIANLGRVFTNNPQIAQLATDSESLTAEFFNWLAHDNDNDIASYCAYEKIKTKGVFIVDERSARSLCNEDVDTIESNHIDIVKPTGSNDERYDAFRNAFQKSRPPLPEMPSSGFNIAVAELQTLDAAGERVSNPEGRDISASAAGFLSQPKITGEIFDVVGDDVFVWGPNEDIAPVLHVDEAETIADRLNADILVFGNLWERSSSVSEVEPFFYVPELTKGRAPELLGKFALGPPLEYRQDNQASKKQLNKRLNERLETLARLIMGFGYYDHGRLWEYEMAAKEFSAAAETGWDAHSARAGLDVINLFLGKAYQRQADMQLASNDGVEAKGALLCQAMTAYEEGLAVNGNYGRLRNGLGSVFLEMARIGSNPHDLCGSGQEEYVVLNDLCNPAWDCYWDCKALNAAESQFALALETLAEDKTVAEIVTVIGHLGLGQVNFHRAMCKDPETVEYARFVEASRLDHDKVLDMYAKTYANSSTSFYSEYAVLAHQDLGLLDLRYGLKHIDESGMLEITRGAEHLDRAIELCLGEHLNSEIHRDFAKNLMPYLLVALCINEEAEDVRSKLDTYGEKFTNWDEIKRVVLDETQDFADFVRQEDSVQIPEDCINEIHK